jgi:hypothetical protein
MQSNIGRAYERMQRYPEAFYNYTRSLEGEIDGAQRKRVEEALERVSPSVAIIDAVTSPAGAKIYIERKDLGAWGRRRCGWGWREVATGCWQSWRATIRRRRWWR